MSAFVNDNNEFIKFYGTCILASVKNLSDFVPLMSVLNNIKYVKIVNNLHLKIYDIFSQTMASFTGVSCKKIEEWFKKKGGTYHPYKELNYDVILSTHYEAKEIINSLFPQNFVISYKPSIIIYNNKIILKFSFKELEKEIFSELVSSLNELYGNNNTPIRYIVLGYITNAPFKISLEKLKLLNSLIPKYIYVNSPDVYHYTTVDNYKLYSYKMY